MRGYTKKIVIFKTREWEVIEYTEHIGHQLIHIWLLILELRSILSDGE